MSKLPQTVIGWKSFHLMRGSNGLLDNKQHLKHKIEKILYLALSHLNKYNIISQIEVKHWCFKQGNMLNGCRTSINAPLNLRVSKTVIDIHFIPSTQSRIKARHYFGCRRPILKLSITIRIFCFRLFCAILIPNLNLLK